jgi:hypothetical protein
MAISAETKVPYSMRPTLYDQWNQILGSIQQPAIVQVMKQTETEVADLLRNSRCKPNPELDAMVLRNNVDLLFKRLAEHYHYQFRDVYYPNIPTDYASYVHLQDDFRKESLKANQHYSQALNDNQNFGEKIYLESRDLSVIPVPSTRKSFPKLKQIWLSKNQIRWLPTNWFDRFSQIEVLDLSRNKITTIPNSISHLTNLQKLYLDHNNIENVPESIGHLSKLVNLSFSQNRIKALPESIGNLKDLKFLSLGENKLRILPSSMKNLNLSDFWLNCGRMRSNPILLLFFGRHQKGISNGMYNLKPDMDQNDLPILLSKMKIFREYVCRSEFAKLCQVLVTNDDSKIQEAFKTLKAEDKNLIYQCVYELSWILKGGPFNLSYPQWTEQQAFEDMGLFCHAVAHAVWEKFDRLSDDQSNAVFGKVYELADSPQTSNPTWGEENAFDEVLRFVDAMDGFEDGRKYPNSY